jgi:hypothetical protein
MSVTHKDIVDLLAATGASETETQNKVALFETSNEEGKQALFDKLSALPKTGVVEQPEQEDKSVASEGVNKGTVKTVKATKAAVEEAEKQGINIGDVPAGQDGKVDLAEVNAFVASKRNG